MTVALSLISRLIWILASYRDPPSMPAIRQRHPPRSSPAAHPLTNEMWPAGSFTHTHEPELVLNMRRKT